MPRILALTVAYDGTDWAGSQRQSQAPSIQGALEDALRTVLHHPVTLVAAGRTDAGVHALGQVVSCATENPIPVDRLPRALNRLLPASIVVRRAREEAAGFHARWSATFRRYWYVVQPTRWPDPLRGRFSWQCSTPLEAAWMQAALGPLVGRHDFAALCHGGEESLGSTVRTVQRAAVYCRKGRIIIDVQADAFLRQMVRLLVANLVLIGSGERPIGWLEELLQSRNRWLAGKAAPARGLLLMRVGYAAHGNHPPMGEDVGDVSNEELFGETQ